MMLRTGLATLLSLTAFAAVAGPTSYPLTLENCGETLTFDAAPATAVTVGQAATEVLYALGLGEKVTGTSVWFSEVLPEFAELAQLNARGMPVMVSRSSRSGRVGAWAAAGIAAIRSGTTKCSGGRICSFLNRKE